MSSSHNLRITLNDRLYLTDACVDLGRSPDLYVNEKVREIAPVRVVGTYGSEMLLRCSDV